ncbi:MAG: hypothetical protein GY835_06140 [bacterium]|nr:hypothetical protein [bacterium]
MKNVRVPSRMPLNRTGTPARHLRVGATLLALILLAAGLSVTGNASGASSHDAPAGYVPPVHESYMTLADRDLQLDYTFKVQNVGNLALAVSNHGFLGDNFAQRDPSMEYPKGSEVDHMVRAGLWIGGLNTNFDTLVTTGVQDGYWGTYNRSTEWVPISIEDEDVDLGWIRERSTLPSSPYYDPLNAISEQDFVTGFLDTLDHAHTPVTGNADTYHNASGLIVTQESYAWSYEPADAMVLLKWTIVPTRIIGNTYVGLYAELTTGWKGQYPESSGWPPSSANWFHHHYLYWVDDLPDYAAMSDDPLNLVAEHHYTYGDGHAPQHAGIKFLGAKYKTAGEEWTEDVGRVAWRWWAWEPGSYTMDNDSEKYVMLSKDGIDDWTEITPSGDNSGDSPIMLLDLGPCNLFPGSAEEAPDSLVISFAFLGGDDFDDLVDNALYAQRVYNFNFTVPTPPPSPQINSKIDIQAGQVRLLWEDSPEHSVDAVTHDYDFEGYRIYVGRSAEESSFDLLKQFDLAEIPAKNPMNEAYFTNTWLTYQIDNTPEYETAQEVLDGIWGEEVYRYHGDAVEPFLVTQVDTVGYNTGMEAILLPPEEWVVEVVETDTLTYKYAYDLDNLSDGHGYWAGVTSYDLGNPETPSLESGISQNMLYVIPGLSAAQSRQRDVTVFPNPYRGSASWDGNRATGRYVWFAGLPPRADIKIFTLAGDLVDEISFNRDTYEAGNAAGVYRGLDGELSPNLSGTMAAWDLRNHNGQPVATGLYLFSVRDKSSGDTQQGKFLVLK